ncbi:hypothetical protein [Vulcanisaeta souniana]|nr:hypothetical protein [Vulcanisaeta souniana]
MLLVVALSIFTYYVYQYLTRPTYCMCPAVLLDNVYNTYVYYGGKLIYHGWYFEAWPVPCCDNFPGLIPPITFAQTINETICEYITGITAPPGIINYTCIISRSGNAVIAIPSKIIAQEGRACSIERLLLRFLTYDESGLTTLYGNTRIFIMGIPVIEEFIGSNGIFLSSQEFIVNATRVDNYVIAYISGIELTMNVESVNVRTGITHFVGTITVHYYYSTNVNETNTIIIRLTPRQ